MINIERKSSLHGEPAEEFMRSLESLKIKLWVEEDSLRYKAPKGAMTEDIFLYLKERKEDILQYLREEADNSIFFEPVKTIGNREYYPLSAAQNRMLVLNEIDRESKAYHITQVLKMEGQLDIQRLEKIIGHLISRHESLRTTFTFAEDKPVQKIHPSLDYKPDFAELEDMEQVDRVINDFIRPYDLGTLPLFAIKLIKLTRAGAAPTFFLLLDMHHIISDGVSLGVLVNEINQLYVGRVLPELKIRYVDYVEWYEKLQTGKVMERQKKFWLRHLEGDLPVLALQTDDQRPSAFSFNGGLVKRRIDKKLTDKLYNLARENRVTLYTILFTAFSILVGRYTGQKDIVIGTPTAGRRHADVRNILGNFVNTLAIRSYPSPEKTFLEFLKETGETVLKAFDNQDYPFEQLVQDLKIRRDLSRNPLFDVMFILQNLGIGRINAEGVEISDYETGKGIAQVDIAAIAVETEKGIDLEINYCADLFKKETIAGFLAHFINILEEISQNPGIRLCEIEMLSREERDRLLYGFNNTKADYPGEKTVHRMFEEQVERTPDNTAVLFMEKKLTYRELNSRANQLAYSLRRKGVGRDSITAIIADRSLEMMTGIMAILKAGGAYLPISPAYPEERIRYMLADSGARIVLTQQKYYPSLHILLDGLVREEGRGRIEVVDLEGEGLYAGKDSNIEAINTPQDLAYVIYTSGSTGRPKGVMIEHRSLINRLNWMQKKYPINEQDVILQKTPYTFDVSVWELFWWSVVGAKVCFLAPDGEKDPGVITDAIKRYGVTAIHFVPSMLNAFLDYIEERVNVWRLGSLKRVFASGEALGLRQVERFNRLLHKKHGTTLHNLYGPTEATVDVSWFDCSTGESLEMIPIGKPIDNIRLHVLDGNSRLQPIGVPGELCIAGDGLARGYLNKPELTDEKFVKCPFAADTCPGKAAEGRMYRTGDLARWLPDGNMEYLGRMDNQVKVRGFRIELGEIESELLKHEDVKEAVAALKEGKNGDKYLCAYIVPRRELTVKELREYLMKELPEYMIPMYFTPLDKLPLTSSGKVDRNALVRTDIGLSTGVEYEAPRNETEEKLSRIWGEVLEIQRVGTRDDFFALGGDSLKAIKVVEKANRENMNISLVDILRYRTIADISGASPVKNKPVPDADHLFSFDRMMKRNDKKIKMTSNAKERKYNLSYSPIEYPFFYKCTYSVLLEYLKHLCNYEMELDLLNASTGDMLIGLEYIEDGSAQGNITAFRAINGEKAGYPNALEKLGISLGTKAFPDRDTAIEYITNRLKKGEIVPVTVTTYHLNYTCDYHMDTDKLIDIMDRNIKLDPNFIVTLHIVIVVDITEDSVIVHDTTFSYFGEVPKDEFFKAFEGMRGIEALRGHWGYDKGTPFEVFEINTDKLIRREADEYIVEGIGRYLKDFFADIHPVEKLENGQMLHCIYGFKAVEKIIELFKCNVVSKPYNAKMISDINDVYNYWNGLTTLFRNTLCTLKQYYPVCGEIIDGFDRLILDYHDIGMLLNKYDKANHEERALYIGKCLEKACAFHKELLEKLSGDINLVV